MVERPRFPAVQSDVIFIIPSLGQRNSCHLKSDRFNLIFLCPFRSSMGMESGALSSDLGLLLLCLLSVLSGVNHLWSIPLSVW